MNNKIMGCRVKKSIGKKLKVVVLFVTFISVNYLLLDISLYAAVPQRINYQGKLMDNAGQPVSDGNYSVTFRIYNVSVGGVVLWNENQTASTQDGLFNVILGSVSSINLSFDQDYWLGVEVAGDGEMSPRHRLVSVPYSFRAEDANDSDRLNSQSAGYYLDAGNINSGTLSDSRLSANVTKLGFSIEAIEISPNIVSSIEGVTNDGGNIDLIAGTNMTITPNDAANTITFDGVGGGDNLGNHTATQNIQLNGNYLSGDGGNEGIYVNNDGNVGIGTTTPSTKFHVQGGDVLFKDLSNLLLKLESIAQEDTWLMYRTNGIDRWSIGVREFNNSLRFTPGYYTNFPSMVINTSGNVGIGTTNPLYPLHMGNGAYCSATGVWTNASSRKYKENITKLTKEEAISVLKHLNPVKFNYKIDKEDKYIGFISEDVPELVATKDRKGLCSMDIVGVLTKAVQELQIEVEKLNQKNLELEEKIKQLERQK